MMLDYLDLKEESKTVEKAVEKFINSGYGTGDIAETEEKTLTCSEVGDKIGELI
jgi:3-isopropylmalate dehydrogenase